MHNKATKANHLCLEIVSWPNHHTSLALSFIKYFTQKGCKSWQKQKIFFSSAKHWYFKYILLIKWQKQTVYTEIMALILINHWHKVTVTTVKGVQCNKAGNLQLRGRWEWCTWGHHRSWDPPTPGPAGHSGCCLPVDVNTGMGFYTIKICRRKHGHGISHI